MHKDQDLAYTDRWGRRNYEYVSLGCDNLPVLKGRSPVQCYGDFMRAFRDNFSSYLGSTIVVGALSLSSSATTLDSIFLFFFQEIQVGMGPAGELRYPSYPEMNGTWRFPGIGAFQCYDKVNEKTPHPCAHRSASLTQYFCITVHAGELESGSGGSGEAGMGTRGSHRRRRLQQLARRHTLLLPRRRLEVFLRRILPLLVLPDAPLPRRAPPRVLCLHLSRRPRPKNLGQSRRHPLALRHALPRAGAHRWLLQHPRARRVSPDRSYARPPWRYF